MNRSITLGGCLCVLLTCAQVSGGPWDTVIFRDDFDSCPGPPDPKKWIVNHPGETWWTQGRTHFPDPLSTTGPFPRVERVRKGDEEIGVCVIEHHLFNPWDSLDDDDIFPRTFLGGEIHTVQEFDPDRAYRFEARVRWNEDPPYAAYPGGLVNSFFLYGYDGAKNDEIDIELVSNLINSGYTVTTNTYNESCQKPHCPCLECPCDCPWVDGCMCVEMCSCVGDECAAPPGLDLTEWQTFRIYWYPSQRRIEWTWVLNPHTPEEIEIPLREPETDPYYIPDEAMALYFNFWAPDALWGCAYDGNLQPVNAPSLNQVHRYEIDYVEVRVGEDANFDTQVKLTPSDGAAGDSFGVHVALSGGTAVIGASGDDDMGTFSGSAYVFENVAGIWTQTAKLTPSDGVPHDHFDCPAVSGYTTVIGADQAFTARPGTAYVFERVVGLWTQTGKLTASDRASGDWFGHSVAVSEDTAVIGAPSDDDACPSNPSCNSGSAYVFERIVGVWHQIAKLNAADGAAGDRFGNSVALSGGTMIIGALFDDDACPGDPYCDSGSAYVFEKVSGAWTQTAKLAAHDAWRRDEFAFSVAVNGVTAVIGSRFNNQLGARSGAAYVFERVGGVWTETAKLSATDGTAGDWFGFSVAVGGDMLVIGAVADENSSGSAYVFRKVAGVWTQTAKFTASDGSASDQFGVSVAASEDAAVIGADLNDDLGMDSGSAYVFFAGAVCGNGIIEGTEECDDGGESARCDADCTFVKCGDGTRNVTAGEDCEPPGCDCCDASCHFDASGTTCADDGNPCTDDVCDGSGTCEHPNDDTESPSISCPPVSVQCLGLGSRFVNYPPPTVSDNCDPNPTVTCTPPSGSEFLDGTTTTVTCTATDASNNAGTCTFDVTVGAMLRLHAVENELQLSSPSPSIKAPLIGLTVGVYDQGSDSCAWHVCGGVSSLEYACIVENCAPVTEAVSDRNGLASFVLPDGEYLAIGNSGTANYLGLSVRWKGICLLTTQPERR